ncbi:hypothetical protein I7I53_11650 [Histoplasma capsulatum var. duboisii H88]|uniref:DDE-1 domain-containing protein n=1 Tax=Ajellomyces capsulatus (strain H88) TaxID=544711 RepID=A0A8A1LY37_AJEC8|nr:hypothetical protein I7I53_11650 [Histoplasma capsulatum var. duboisii H88]
MFNKHTQACTVGRYRVLILDRHGSHNTAAFEQFCKDQTIIPLYIPSHSSHLLQPLDVSCFAVLKKAYSKQIESGMQLEINHVDKNEFLNLYSLARKEALKDTTIRAGFKVTGLVPFNSAEVLDKLHLQLHTSSSPGSSHGSQSTWTSKTPQNPIQLKHQTSKIKQFLKHRT